MRLTRNDYTSNYPYELALRRRLYIMVGVQPPKANAGLLYWRCKAADRAVQGGVRGQAPRVIGDEG